MKDEAPLITFVENQLKAMSSRFEDQQKFSRDHFDSLKTIIELINHDRILYKKALSELVKDKNYSPPFRSIALKALGAAKVAPNSDEYEQQDK